MAETASTMLALGTLAPDFTLTDVVSGESVSLATFRDERVLLVIFICAHCPYVVHMQDELAKLGQDYQGNDVGIVAISSNDPALVPEDGPDGLKEMAETVGFTFPYCFDETQQVARAFSAACTPDVFLFDEHRKLVYRGQFDDSRPGNGKPVTGRDVRAAVNALLSGHPVSAEQRPSTGCSIKWRQ